MSSKNAAPNIGSLGSILIIENDEGIAWLMSSRLTEQGYDVRVDPSDDLSIVGSNIKNFDLLIFDYKLNGTQTGLDCYRSLKEKGINVPMILVTGFGDEAVLVEALRLGVRDFVPKTGQYLEMLSLSVGRVMEQVRSERKLQELLIAESSRAALEKSLSDVEALAERLRLSSMEAHHRVKNSFQIVTSLLSLQLRRKGTLGKEDIQVITAQVRGLSLIHDILTNLMKAGRVEAAISLGELIEKLVTTLPHSMTDKPIEITIKTDRSVLPRVASSVAVILTELLLNALKHGTGGITVTCEDSSIDRAKLTVSNDGTLSSQGEKSESKTGVSLIKFLASTDLGVDFEQHEKSGRVVSSCSIPLSVNIENKVTSLGDFA